MKGLLFVAILVSVSTYGNLDDFHPITGILLEHWQEAAPTSFLTLDSLPVPIQFDGEVTELCITGIEVTSDSLNLYLLGIPKGDGTPLFLAGGGYRGEYNLAKSFAGYEEGEICIYFQMPYSARYSKSAYSWDSDSNVLIETEHITGDPSIDGLERVDGYLETGEIEEAISELNDMMYPGNYFNTDEMVARLLRTANRFALIESEDENYSAAIRVFETLSGFAHGSADRYPNYYDSSEYAESDFSSYMELSEYVEIINNHAFFLEKTDDLERAASVLRQVLRLDPSRMVAYLNSADVAWGMSKFTESERFYTTYLWMMTESGLATQIPSRVTLRTHMFIGDSEDIELYESYFPGEEGLLSTPDWSIMPGFQGRYLLDNDSHPLNSLLFSIPDFGESEDLALIAKAENGDTLWICTFEGVPLEWFHSPDVMELPSGGYMVENSPDCHATDIYIHRLSESGSEIFSCNLESSFMLDLIGASGEISPRVKSFRETSDGDILVCGKVSLWMTGPQASFVCRLDGETGEILWKVVDYGLGMASAFDVTETSSGSFVAVGTTGICNAAPHPRTGYWGSTTPFVLMIDSDGEFQKSIAYPTDLTDWFSRVVELEACNNEYLVVGTDTLTDERILFKAVFQVDP